MLRAVEETAELPKPDAITGNKHYVETLKQHLKFKNGHKWVFQMDNTTSHTVKSS